MSPVSMPSFICIVVTPVLSSPLIIAHCIGAEPRYFGNRDACILIQPYLGISRISLDTICPNATTTITSGLISFNIFTNSASLTLTGWYTVIPCFNAASLTGVNCT